MGSVRQYIRVGDGVEVRAAYLVSPLDDFKTHTISQIIGSIIAESRFRHDQVRGWEQGSLGKNRQVIITVWS